MERDGTAVGRPREFFGRRIGQQTPLGTTCHIEKPDTIAVHLEHDVATIG